jgi:hypothetical protein
MKTIVMQQTAIFALKLYEEDKEPSRVSFLDAFNRGENKETKTGEKYSILKE